MSGPTFEDLQTYLKLFAGSNKKALRFETARNGVTGYIVTVERENDQINVVKVNYCKKQTFVRAAAEAWMAPTDEEIRRFNEEFEWRTGTEALRIALNDFIECRWKHDLPT